MFRMPRLFAAFIAGLAIIGSMSAARGQNSSLPVIDTHVHFLPKLVLGQGLDFSQGTHSAIKTMDRFGLATSIMMSPPRPRRGKLNYDYPDFRAAIAGHGNRFIFVGGGGTLNPLLHAHADAATVTNNVRRQFARFARRAIDDGAVGFGEMSSLHISLSKRHGYSYVPADHPLLLLLADIAAEKDVPIDLHMDALSVPRKPPSRLAKFPNNPKIFPATIDALNRLLSHNPSTRIIWAHGGSDKLGEFTAKLIGKLMDRHSNLFMSLRVNGPRATTYNKLFKGRRLEPRWRSLLARHSDRFVIGTDSFYTSSDLKGVGPIAKFSRMNEPKFRATRHFLSLLPFDLARKIASQNAIRIYRLDASKIPTVRATIETVAGRLSFGGIGGNRLKLKRGRRPSRLCRDGNMAHCRVACQRGHKKACNRLKRAR